MRSWELGFASSRCLALSVYHATTISLFPQREKCVARRRNLNALWKLGGHTAGPNHATLYSSAFLTVSPSPGL